jgi:hypothetical protein
MSQNLEVKQERTCEEAIKSRFFYTIKLVAVRRSDTVFLSMFTLF